jgi:hypothetical protein
MVARILLALVVASLLVGCKRTPSGPDTSPLRLPALAVGEVHTANRPAAEIIVEGGAQGGEYVLVALNATGTAGSRLALEFSGTGLTPLEAASPAALAAMQAEPDTREARRERGRAQLERELWLRQQRQLEPMIEEARREMLRRSLMPATVARPQALAVGDSVTFNTSASCTESDRRMRGATIVARSAHAVVAVDTGVPRRGFTTEDFVRFAEQYDAHVHPLIVENFGAPANPFGTDGARVVLFFTPAVNLMATSAGFVAGFFWPGDLFPRAGEPGRFAACSGSNEREIVYLLVPDEDPPRYGQVHRRDAVERITLSTIAHEVQHVVNAGRRMYVDPRAGFEDVWLNEALSHVAEELLMYRTGGLAPRSRIDAATLRSSGPVLDAFLRHQLPNFRRYRWHLANPDSSLISTRAPLESRGASWNFLRFAADHRGGDESQLWQAMVNTNRTGMENLQAALGADAFGRMLDWSVSVYADGVVPGLAARWRQPSWEIREVTGMVEVHSVGGYPLAVRPLSAETETFSLGAGGNAYLRFRVEPGASGRVQVSSGGRVPPAQLRYAVVRVQ